jgi:hypothetical protein
MVLTALHHLERTAPLQSSVAAPEPRRIVNSRYLYSVLAAAAAAS